MTKNKYNFKCPNCHELISEDFLYLELEKEVRKEFEGKQIQMEADIKVKEEELRLKEIMIENNSKIQEEEVKRRVAEQISSEKINIVKRAREDAEKENLNQVKLLEDELKEKDKKLSLANEEALKLRLSKQQLESDKRDFELEKTRQLDEERTRITEEAGKKAAEDQQYNIAQLQKKLSDAIKANEDMARKLEQGSQQAQGEVLELKLETALKTEFTSDEILPVPKGMSGADIIQKVFNSSGRECGQIIWESKNTKGWSEGWVQKLKDNQRAIKADISVIVSTTVPEGVSGFMNRDGVWICEANMALPLATALRTILVAVKRERTVLSGKEEKKEILFDYITGVQFRQRVEAIVESYMCVERDLRKERVAYERIWAEREKQIGKILLNTAGIYGDLSGLVPLSQIKTLELPAGEGRNEVD